MPRSVSVAALRRQIDRIDDRLLELLNARAALALRIGAHKARANAGVYDPAREKVVLRRLTRLNGGPLPAGAVRAVFAEIMSAGRALQQRLRVAFFGPEATWTHLAARRQFGDGADYVPVATIPEVFQAVERRQVDLGVVPVENSTEGAVARTLDLLVDSPLSVCGEVALPVRHCLLVRRGTGLTGIRRVTAHPQALAQCRGWLASTLPGVRTEEASSNARAAERARDEAGTAAIAAEAAAATYGLVVLVPAIQDEVGNTTRFLILGRQDCARPSGDDKTSVVFSVRDEVGILVRMLKPFAAHEIDLIKIESRPLRERPWEYYFFIDLKGHRAEPRVQRSLAEVERRALRFRLLGSYPAAPEA
ncbi:MAG: prephenate dehydratase [Candidatus Binatia bacterium]